VRLGLELKSKAESMRERAAEQDRAAGGRRRREIRLADGSVVRASVALLQHRRAVYAYLRYSVNGRTVTRYVGPVRSRTRRDALREGWSAARSSGLLSKL
jgi:DNA mismatch endonuclease (patch repair protein)